MRLLFTLLFVAAFATVGFGQGIDGTAHDFEAQSWTTEVCAACHTPHASATDAVVGAPLWNHQISVKADFTPYASSTITATMGQPGGTSMLCLSCHDGTVALENFGGMVAGTNYILTGLIDDELGDDHPISFTYDLALSVADPGLYDPANRLSGLGANIDDDMLSGAGNDQMECSSCHDVHNSAGIASLLRMSNVGSLLCLTCHNK